MDLTTVWYLEANKKEKIKKEVEEQKKYYDRKCERVLSSVKNQLRVSTIFDPRWIGPGGVRRHCG
jgi:hypothetical protein